MANSVFMKAEEVQEMLGVSRSESYRSIKKLKPEYCEVLWLTYFEGFSHKEAAGIMKKSVHNIDTLVWRAKKALKAELFKEGFVYEEC